MGKIELKCIVCGKPVFRELGEVNRTRKPKTGPFCSRPCSNRYIFSGRKLSSAHKEKLKGRTPWNKGKNWSPEMKQKLSDLASDGSRAMEKNGNWKGGRSITEDGYVEIRVGGKPKLEHRHVVELDTGKPLPPELIVHHEKGKQDNNREDLTPMTKSAHMKLHHPNGIIKHVRTIICAVCSQPFQGKPPERYCPNEECKKEQKRRYWRKKSAKRRQARSAQPAISL